MSDRIISSRPIFLATAVTVVLAAGGIGLTVGATDRTAERRSRCSASRCST
ncbi:hypothetical protein [Haladaptatus sp. W1]|uniref:hypothetical protein n=1 Tax=Haladaptatus sp. W1 TaxID=1897478 RepID=UPI0020C77C07|nr:hypothetical protein [Haladaptatus sp. W1]